MDVQHIKHESLRTQVGKFDSSSNIALSQLITPVSAIFLRLAPKRSNAKTSDKVRMGASTASGIQRPRSLSVCIFICLGLPSVLSLFEDLFAEYGVVVKEVAILVFSSDCECSAAVLRLGN